MSVHLIRSAQARHEDTLKRATTALRHLAQAGEPITFAAVARKAGVSTDFLYGTATLRAQITELRQQPSTSRPSPVPAEGSQSTAAVRALSAQLKQQRRRHREEIQALESRLAAAHGENLKLRRRLAPHDE